MPAFCVYRVLPYATRLVCFLCFLFISITVGLFSSVEAAERNLVYLTATIKYRPLTSTSGVTIYFEPDEALCRKEYGADWKDKCDVWLGESGSVPKGLEAHDWPHGRWTWSSSNSLRFEPSGEPGGIPDITGKLTPSGRWKSATEYTANLQNLVLPPRVELLNLQTSVETLPLCTRSGTGEMWIDPSDKGEHAISFALEFTAPVEAHQRTLLEIVTPTTESKGLELGKSKWIWLDDNTRAIVNTPVLALPSEESIVKLTLPHIRPLWEDDSSWRILSHDSVHELVVKGMDSLFGLQSVSLEQVQNKSLQMEQHLVFLFSRRVTPESLRAALTVLELPENRSSENILPSDWRHGNVAPDDMKKARTLVPQLVSVPGEPEDYIRFRLDATPGRYIMWNIAAGFGPMDNSGKKSALQRSLEGVEYVAQGSARIELLQAGNVLMVKDQARLPILSEHVDSIRWKAHRFRDENLSLPFINSLNDTYIADYDLDASTVVNEGELRVTPNVKSGGAETIYTSTPAVTSLLANSVFTKGGKDIAPGVVYLSLEGIRDGEVVASAGRVLMYSNLGLVVKTLPDGSRNVFVCTLDDAKAKKGVDIQVLGMNGVPVAEAKTDSAGMAVLPSLSHLTREKTPVAIVASYSWWGDTDKIWMSLTDRERTTNMGSFADIQGQQRSESTLNAFVFAERGMFRPGETLNFGTLLRNNDWSLLPPNMPLVANLYDPMDRQVLKKPFVAGTGVHSFSWEAPEHAMTGRYRLTISTPAALSAYGDGGLVLGSTTVRVEMFLPDTLKIKTSLEYVAEGATSADAVLVPEAGKGWLVMPESGSGIKTMLRTRLDNLYGQAAQGRRVEASMRLSPAYLHFKGFENYQFQDLSSFFAGGMDAVTRPLGEGITNDAGEAVLPLDLAQWRFGTLQCTIATQGFEPDGGRSVAEERNFLVSPLTYMLGYKQGDDVNNMHFIDKGSVAHVDFVTIDGALQPTNPGSLTFTLSRRDEVISLVTNAQGEYIYEENPVETELSQSVQQLSQDGTLHWALPTQDVGDFLLTVKAGKGAVHEGVVLARIPFSIAGTDDARPALQGLYSLPSATLRIKTDKTAYTGGDKAKVLLTSPYDGVALISLERDSVAAHTWVRVPVGQSVHELQIPKDFAGRGYISVLMGRAPHSNAIFMQPQSVALASVSVNSATRQLTLTMDVPETVRPGEALRWNVKSADGKPMQAILFAVDEGILQLTRFRTPNPLQYLLLDRALEVETSQLFDVMMADDAMLLRRISAFGGDGSAADLSAMLGSFQNPFKRSLETPMVWWGGVMEIGADGITVDVPVPDHYNGKVRLMVVGNQSTTVGSAQENVFVRGELVLVPQLPSMAALGDSFEAGLGISNTTDKEVTLLLSAAPTKTAEVTDLQLAGLPPSITLGPKQEKLVPLTVRVGKQAGNAELLFTASTQDGSLSQKRTASMSVRPGQLPRQTQQAFMLTQNANLSVQRQLLPLQEKQDVHTSLSLSTTPMPLLRSVLAYLHNYPYDCVEQSISKAFPLSLLVTMPQFATMITQQTGLMTDKDMEKTLKQAHDAMVGAYRRYDGMSIWVDSDASTLFLTAYAADYILAMREANIPLPPGLVPQLFNTLENSVNNRPDSLYELRDMAYAAWVLARAGYVVSRPLELCESFLRDEPQGSDIFRSLMAGAYATLHMQDEAREHLNYVLDTQPAEWESDGHDLDLLSQYGLHTVILARHFPKYFSEAMPFLQEAMLEELNKHHATLGAAMAARGLLEVLKVTPQTLEMATPDIQCKNYGEGFAPASAPMVEVLSGISVLHAPGCTNFVVQVPQGQKFFAEIDTYGYDLYPPTQPVKRDLQVQKRWSIVGKDGAMIPFTGTVSQGDIVRVDVDVELLYSGNVDVAVVDLLPGGFELVSEYAGDTYPSSDIRLDRREDRFIAYITASDYETTLTYHIRAITKGEYTLPAAQAEGLFDTSVEASSSRNRVKVVK